MVDAQFVCDEQKQKNELLVGHFLAIFRLVGFLLRVNCRNQYISTHVSRISFLFYWTFILCPKWGQDQFRIKKNTVQNRYMYGFCTLLELFKTADAGTVSIFTKHGVTVHKEQDMLITFKGQNILIGAWDEQGRYRIPLIQQRGHWQPHKSTKK